MAEPNISDWRRSICGDLMSCFDFTSSNSTIPALPNTASMRQRADELDGHLPPAKPPKGKQEWPKQDPGQVPARPLPYQPLANFAVGAKGLHFTLANTGAATVPFAMYLLHPLGTASVKNIDVSAGGTADGSIPLDESTSSYDVWTHGPNGFLAHAVGDMQSNELGVEATLSLVGTSTHPSLRLSVSNSGTSEATVQVRDRQGQVQVLQIDPDGAAEHLRYDPIGEDHGWYELTLTLDQSVAFGRLYAGHLENGNSSITG